MTAAIIGSFIGGVIGLALVYPICVLFDRIKYGYWPWTPEEEMRRRFFAKRGW